MELNNKHEAAAAAIATAYILWALVLFTLLLQKQQQQEFMKSATEETFLWGFLNLINRDFAMEIVIENVSVTDYDRFELNEEKMLSDFNFF